MVEAIEQRPAMPEWWGGEQKGMQSGDALIGMVLDAATDSWLKGAREALFYAERMNRLGLHKSLCNRIIEPWAHMSCLITATDRGLSNFFALRAHPAAMPEFQVLAYRMLSDYLKSTPCDMAWGSWHIPEFDGSVWGPDLYTNLKVATARCARLSYLTFDGEHSVDKDVELHDRLAEAGHWSPFEHCARSAVCNDRSNFDVGYDDGNPGESGWQQYRKQFASECVRDADLPKIMKSKPEWITIPEESLV